MSRQLLPTALATFSVATLATAALGAAPAIATPADEAAAVPAVAATDSAQSGPRRETDTLVVTASPIPRRWFDLDQSVSVIDRDEIRRAPADNLATLLQYAGGVDVRQRGGRGVQADVGIRGTAFEQTLVMVDGIRMSDPQTGHHDLNLPVPLAHIERIEILKGPGSAAYGPNATGGAINVITRRPQRPEAGFSVQGGEYGYRAVSGHAGLAGNGRRGSHLVSGSLRRADGHIGDQPTDFDLRSARYSGHWALGDHALRAGVGIDDRDFGAYRFYVDRFPDQREQTRTLAAHVAADTDAGAWTLSPGVYWRRHEDWFRTRDPSFAADSINEHETDVYGARVGAVSEWAGGVTALGASYTRETIDSTALGDRNRHEASAWAEHQWTLRPGLRVAASGAVVDYSEHGTEWLPGLALNVATGERSSVFASAARSARVPSWTERFLPGGAGNRGNAAVGPERSNFAEAGWRWADGPHAVSTAAFVRRTSNLIDWGRATPNTDFEADNFRGHRTVGGELEYGWRGRHGRVEHLRVAYTWLDTSLDTRGRELRYALEHPRHEFTTRLGLAWLPALTQSVQARWADRRGGESALLVDSRLALRVGRIELSLEGNNLLNERYVEAGFAPLPGRWLVAGIAVDL